MRIALLVLAGLAMLWATPARAFDTSISRNWLLGFGGDKTTHGKTNNPKPPAITRPGEKKPSMLSKITDGPKRLASGTKSLFTSKKTSTRKSGTTSVQKVSDKNAPKQGFFQSLVNPEPPPPPKTVKEWMSLKQIHP